MKLSKVLSPILGIIGTCLIANAAVAQEPDSPVVQQSDAPIVQVLDTPINRFEGGFFDFNILIGVAHTDKDLWATADSDYIEGPPDQYIFGGLLEFGFGYLWGDKFLIGPELTLALGFPSIIGGDLRLKMLAPITQQFAMYASLGWGVEFRIPYPGKYKEIEVKSQSKAKNHDKNVMYDSMYLPFSLGCEHVFESGFVIGAEMQFRVIFYQDYHRYYSEPKVIWENGSSYIGRENYGEDYVPQVTLGEYVIGLHMGYKF